jgi:hypothetical protein
MIPNEKKLKKIIYNTDKPVIISIRHSFTALSKLCLIAKKLETLGVAGFFVGRKFPYPVLKKICSECSVPVFSASGTEMEDIRSKIDAGVFAVCISGKNISKELVGPLHKQFPDVPVLASCNRSEKIMHRSVKSGTDAVIFKPCIPFKMEWRDF